MFYSLIKVLPSDSSRMSATSSSTQGWLILHSLQNALKHDAQLSNMSWLHPSATQVNMPFVSIVVVVWPCLNTDSKVFIGFFTVGTVGLGVFVKVVLAAVFVVSFAVDVAFGVGDPLPLIVLF